MAPQIRSVLHGSKNFSQNPAGRSGEISASQNRLKQNNRIDSFRDDRNVSLNSGAAESGKTPIERKQRSTSDSFRSLKKNVVSDRRSKNIRTIINRNSKESRKVVENRFSFSGIRDRGEPKIQNSRIRAKRPGINTGKQGILQRRNTLSLYARQNSVLDKAVGKNPINQKKIDLRI